MASSTNTNDNKSMIIFSQRSSSTPNFDQNKTLLLDLTPNFDATVEAKSKISFKLQNTLLTPPMFGRQNLLNYRKQRHTQQFNETKKRNEKDSKRYSENVIDTFACSTSSSFQNWETLKANDNRFTGCPSTADKTRKAQNGKTSRRSGVYSKTKKRRSKSATNNQPTIVVSVVPKCPKSPRLLLAMREKRRSNQERLGKENKKTGRGNNRLTLVPRTSGERPTTKINTKKSINNVKSSTIPMAQRDLNKRNLVLEKKERKVGHKSQEESNQVFTPFKAHPIRKYVPLPNVKTRNLTIPVSPKLGKRRQFNQV